MGPPRYERSSTFNPRGLNKPSVPDEGEEEDPRFQRGPARGAEREGGFERGSGFEPRGDRGDRGGDRGGSRFGGGGAVDDPRFAASGGGERRKLQLAPRNSTTKEAQDTERSSSKPDPFGGAKARVADPIKEAGPAPEEAPAPKPDGPRKPKTDPFGNAKPVNVSYGDLEKPPTEEEVAAAEAAKAAAAAAAAAAAEEAAAAPPAEEGLPPIESVSLTESAE